MNDMSAPAGVGHNNPPTPYDEIRAEIEQLYSIAKSICDGAPIETPRAAAEVEDLQKEIKAAIKRADDERKAEAKPHDDAKKAIQDRYNLLIGETKAVTGIAVLALEACKKALTPWLLAEQRRKDEEARKAREEAEAARRAAETAVPAVSVDELEAREQALAEAAAAEKDARRAVKAATTRTGLRTTFQAVLLPDGLSPLCREIWDQDRNALAEFATAWAQARVTAAGARAEHMAIPGVEIIKVQEAR